jgi:hypothetical protein
MKSVFIVCTLFALPFKGYSQKNIATTTVPDPTKKILTVDASCGECNFDMQGKDCDLAVRINGTPYFVDGANIMDYGHPHAKGGFCLAVRRAEVQGEVVNGRFKASYFKLLDNKPAIDNKNKKN